MAGAWLGWLMLPSPAVGNPAADGADDTPVESAAAPFPPDDPAADRLLRDEAARSWIRNRLDHRDFTAAKAAATAYLADPEHRTAVVLPEVLLGLAEACDGLGDLDGAAAAYVKVWSAYLGRIGVSAPAIRRWMEILWQRNLPGRPEEGIQSDRQGAYNGGANYLEATSRQGVQTRMTQAEKDQWQQVARLVATYAADPGIVSLAQHRRNRTEESRWRFPPLARWLGPPLGIVLAVFAVIEWNRRSSRRLLASLKNPLDRT